MILYPQIFQQYEERLLDYKYVSGNTIRNADKVKSYTRIIRVDIICIQ